MALALRDEIEKAPFLQLLEDADIRLRRSSRRPIMISDPIPIELILEILLRLPEKSIKRFHCVSKLWGSLLRVPYFTELFLTRSSARPRLLFALEKNGLWNIFSLPQHLNRYEKSSSSLVLTAELHMKFSPDNFYCRRRQEFKCGYASGLIFFVGSGSQERDYHGVPVICNPITGRYAVLPYLPYYVRGYSFFGFDPIDKQYKVLFMADPSNLDDSHKILTLGTGKKRWRRIKCSLRHYIVKGGICINGVLYYAGQTSESTVIVCFDVRCEKFKFIYPISFRGRSWELINYKGKLGVISYEKNADGAIEFYVWVLADAEKQEWSKYAYTLRGDIFLDKYNYEVCVGVTVTDEIVFSMYCFTSEQPFYVFFLNPERNTLQRVEIQGFGGYHEEGQKPFYGSTVHVFADHVEDLNVIDPNLLKPTIYEDMEEEVSEGEE